MPDTATPVSPHIESVTFGRFTFDPRSGELRRDGIPVKLAPKPCLALTRLLASPGRVVLRDELVDTLWSDSPPLEVDRSLNFAIRQIREALGDDANNPVFVETLPRRGYRFIAPVASTAHRDAAGASAPAGRRWRSAWTGRAVVGVAIAVVGIATFGLTRTSGGRSAVPMVAVLPFEVRGDSDQVQYLAAGLRDELIAELARLGADRLGVIARESSSRFAAASLVDVADGLGVRYVLRGSVTPRDGLARAAFQLIDTRDGRVVWADRYDGATSVSRDLERVVAGRVADALAVQLVPAPVPTGPTDTPNEEARALYLKGAYLLQSRNRGDRSTGFGLLWAALDADSTYAAPRVLLGKTLLRYGDPSGREMLETALRFDSTAADAHVALADDDLYRRWDFAAAGLHFDRALRLRPGDSGPNHRYAYYLSLLGRHDEALDAVRTALRLDPVSPLITGDVGRLYYRAGRYDEAEKFCGQALELVPANAGARACLLNLRLVRGDVEGAHEHVLPLLEAYGTDPSIVDAVAAMPPREAVDAFWREQVVRLIPLTDDDPDQFVPLAQAHVWLGEYDRALTALESARDRQATALPLVGGDPCFAPLFEHPRYQRVFAQAGLPLTPPPNRS